MNKNDSNLPEKTWSRALNPINKAGYMDGAADGQTAAFQSSFDVGYKQGLIFGFKLGFQKASISLQNQENSLNTAFTDQRNINCQLCINGTTTQEKVDNLYNIQEEDNMKYLKWQKKT